MLFFDKSLVRCLVEGGAAFVAAEFSFQNSAEAENGVFIAFSAHNLNAERQPVFINSNRNGQGGQSPDVGIGNVRHICIYRRNRLRREKISRYTFPCFGAAE